MPCELADVVNMLISVQVYHMKGSAFTAAWIICQIVTHSAYNTLASDEPDQPASDQIQVRFLKLGHQDCTIDIGHLLCIRYTVLDTCYICETVSRWMRRQAYSIGSAILQTEFFLSSSMIIKCVYSEHMRGTPLQKRLHSTLTIYKCTVYNPQTIYMVLQYIYGIYCQQDALAVTVLACSTLSLCTKENAVSFCVFLNSDGLSI